MGDSDKARATSREYGKTSVLRKQMRAQPENVDEELKYVDPKGVSNIDTERIG